MFNKTYRVKITEEKTVITGGNSYAKHLRSRLIKSDRSYFFERRNGDRLSSYRRSQRNKPASIKFSCPYLAQNR